MGSDHVILDDQRPTALAQKRFDAHRREFAGLDIAERFVRIHEINLWGADTSVSGLGSELAATATIRNELRKLLRRLGVSSLLDAPCGDAGWIRGVDLGGVSYVGVDIVPDLIDRLRERDEPAGRYLVADIVSDRLPPCDAILCRDCLVHLSFEHATMAIENLRRSGARWLIATTFSDLTTNHDCEDGDWRPLNMSRAPFNWPTPAPTIVEGCEEDGGGWRDKSLGVWRLDGPDGAFAADQFWELTAA